MFKCGIYKIVHISSGKCYIGSAQDCLKRRNEHFKSLRRGDHHSRYLQRAWNKYGETGFNFQLMIVCLRDDLFFYEQRFLDILKPKFNVNPSACGTRGLFWTEESKLKLKGRVITKEWRKAISLGVLSNTTPEQRIETARLARNGWTEESRRSQIEKLTGQKDSVETREKKRQKLLGHVVSQETRDKLAMQKGWKHSDEAKAKMRGRVVSEITRSLMREQRLGKPGPLLGKPRSEETKAKLRLVLKGRPRSIESIAKQRATIALKRKKEVETK